MKDEKKTKRQLLDELTHMRSRVAQLEEVENKRKRTEAALEESEKRFSAFMEHLPAGAFIKDQTGRLLFVNRYIEEFFGFQEYVGKTTEQLLPHEVAERMVEDDRKVLTEGPMVLQEKITDIHGGEHFFHTYKFPIEVEGSPALVAGIKVDITERKLAEVQTTRLNALKEQLIGRGALNEKLRTITEAVVQICDADFARIWITREGDLCEKGCFHAHVTEGPHVCRDRSRCLHLVAGSGRYTHLDGSHRRVPLGAYKIGNIASGRDTSFLTNDVTHDPNIHNHEWAAALGLVSFAGFRLISPDGNPIGVLALFKKQPITPEETRLLEGLANSTSQVIRAGMAEEALRESENRFRSLVLNSSDVITVLGADGSIRYQSPSLKRFCGYEPEDLIGKNAFSTIHPDDRAAAQAAFSQIQEQPGASVSLEYRFRHANGSWIFVESVGSSFLDDPGIKGVVLNSRDISERKRAEEALEKRIVALTQPLDAVESIALDDLLNLNNLQRLQDLLADSWGVAVLFTRPDGTPITQPSNFTYFCSGFIRKTEEGARNCQISDAMLWRHNPSGPIIQKCLSAGLWGAGASITIGGRHIANWLIGQVRNEAQSEEQMLEYARKIGADETAFLEAYRKVPVMSQEKFEKISNALFALANQLSTTAYQNIQQARFIAEHKRTELALHESQQLLQSVLDTIPVRVFWKSLDSTYLGCNHAFALDAGLQSPEKIIGKNDYDMVWAEQAEAYHADDRLVMETGRRKLCYEEPQTTPGAGKIWLLKNKVPLLDNKGKIKGILGTYEDITKRKQAEKALEESSQKLKLFAYSVAHDLKSPAVGVYGLTKRLSRHARDVLDEKGRTYCDQILKVSEHIAALVDKINVYIATKEARLSIETIRLADILHMLKDEFSAQLRVRQIDWLEPDTPLEIRADRLCMLRAFRNFVDNSLKYGGERLSKIWIGHEEVEGFHVLSFSDNGKGLKEEDCEKIFGAFQRNETSRGVEGAGLGLTIVKEIAEQHGGAVWVEPRGKKGVTFYLSISKNLE